MQKKRCEQPLFGVALPPDLETWAGIHGGDNPNRMPPSVPGLSSISGLAWHGPGLRSVGDINERLQIIARRAPGEISASKPAVSGRAARWTPRPRPRSVAASSSSPDYSAGSVAFATEGPYLESDRLLDADPWPGDIEQAHQPDGILPMDRIDPTV